MLRLILHEFVDNTLIWTAFSSHVVSLSILTHSPDPLLTVTFFLPGQTQTPTTAEKNKKEYIQNFILWLVSSLTHVSHHHFLSPFRLFPAPLLSPKLSLAYLLSAVLLAGLKATPGGALWPSRGLKQRASQLSDLLRRSTSSVACLPAPPILYSRQPESQDEWKSRRGKGGWERWFSDSLLKTWSTSCTTIFTSHAPLLTHILAYLLTHTLPHFITHFFLPGSCVEREHTVQQYNMVACSINLNIYLY